MVLTRELYFDASSGDREYQAIAWSYVFRTMFTDGAVPGYVNSLEVVPQSPEDMTVRIRDGAAFLEGKFFELTDGPSSVTVAAADADNDRIDRVVIQVHYSDRRIYHHVKTGTAATTPSPPSLQRDSSIYEISLAQLYVNAGTASIVAGDITDERPDRAVCGWAVPWPLVNFYDAYFHAASHAPGAGDDLSGDYAARPHDNADHNPDMATKSEHDNHVGDTTNPHTVTAAQAGASANPHGAGDHDTSVTTAQNGAENVWVQSSAPSALATNDLWVEI